MSEGSRLIRRIRRAGALAALATLVAQCGGSPTGPAPVTLRVTGIQPTTGSTFGGTSITVTGAAFSPDAIVVLGGSAASQHVVVNDTTITAITPAHVTGVVDIMVVAAGRQAVLPAAFAFALPATGPNEPPKIDSVRAQGSRANQPAGMADLREAIAVSATVTDTESAIDSLIYEWTATSGAFEGRGQSVVWRAPASLPRVPSTETLTLTVIERYTVPDEQGLPVTREHRVGRTVDVRVHDSINEVSDLAREFLEMFSNSIVPASQVVSGFSDKCGGKFSEQREIEENRCVYNIDASFVGSPATSINFGGVCSLGTRLRQGDACALVAVRWTSTVKATALQCQLSPGPLPKPGETSTTRGTDLVTAIYDAGRWRLCDSDYVADGAATRFKR